MKRLASNLILVAVAVALCLVLFEGVLRAFPNRFAQRFETERTGAGTVAYRPIGGGLHSLVPGKVMESHGACFATRDIRTNSLGFRGPEWRTPVAGPRIAVLGDSFVEALQVDGQSHVSARLGAATGYDTLNFGISAYATRDQAWLYKEVVRPLRPDLAVLFFFVGNDISGNGCLFGRRFGRCSEPTDDAREPGNPKPKAASAPEAVEQPSSSVSAWDGLKAFFRRHLVIYQVLHSAKLIVTGAVNSIRGHVPPQFRLYLDPPDPDWQQAWAATADALSTLKEATAADGVPLAVVLIPAHLALAPNWRTELRFGVGSAVPEGFDPSLPSRRLAGVLDRLRVPYLDLLPVLSAYRERHSMSYPYFSFACDGHWNPLTHQLAAAEVAVFLEQSGLVPRAAEPLVDARDRLFARPPENILGPDWFDAIYRGGVLR